MIIFLKKAWDWIKKYWKWILFPIGILLAIAGFIAGRMTRKTVPPTPGPVVSGDDELNQVVTADAERDKKLQELREKNQARLESLTAEQQKELDELKDKPLEEVVSWFDRL